MKVCIEFIKPFYKNWKDLEKLSTENVCKAILSAQNDDIFYQVGLLCLRMHETFELEAL